MPASDNIDSYNYCSSLRVVYMVELREPQRLQWPVELPAEASGRFLLNPLYKLHLNYGTSRNHFPITRQLI